MLSDSLPITFQGSASIRYRVADGANLACNYWDTSLQLLPQQRSERCAAFTTSEPCDYCGVVVEFNGLVPLGLRVTVVNATSFSVKSKLNGSSSGYQTLAENDLSDSSLIGINTTFTTVVKPQQYDSLLIIASRGSLHNSPTIMLQGAANMFQPELDTVSPY